MLEQLLSLSILLLVCLFLIPLFIDIRNQYRQIEIDHFARQLLYEELQAKLSGGQTDTGYSVFLNGVEYKVNWKNSAIPGESEVCINVDKNSNQFQTEICATQE